MENQKYVAIVHGLDYSGAIIDVDEPSLRKSAESLGLEILSLMPTTESQAVIFLDEFGDARKD